MRRHFRSAGNRRRRAVDWWGGWFYGNAINFGSSDGETVANFWFVWPRGVEDPDNDNFSAEPDDTLVRLITNFNVSTDNLGEQVNQAGIVYFGIHAWDAVEPLDFGLTTGIFPNPRDQGHDWVWRATVPFILENTVGLVDNSDLMKQSKAMRKLAKNTGLVGLISWENSNLNHAEQLYWSWDVRCAIKKAV